MQVQFTRPEDMVSCLIAEKLTGDYHSAFAEAQRSMTYTCKHYDQYCNLVYQIILQKCDVKLPSVAHKVLDLRSLIGMDIHAALLWREAQPLRSPFAGIKQAPVGWIFAVGWEDGTRYITTNEVNLSRIRLSLCKDVVVDVCIG